MSIIQHEGDLLKQSGILVHGANCMGVQGSGVADLIRKKFPPAYRAYTHRYDVFGLQLGDIVAVANPALRDAAPQAVRHIREFDSSIPHDVVVVNAMTQYDYGRNPDIRYADYHAIEAAFVRVRMLALATGMQVNFPLIGCGLANGKWTEVRPRIERALTDAVDGNLWLLPGTSTN
ncbi:macro domain-containing protein [Burkholderia cenocepacia]|uniref:macro domain-containing protein n=1 Tax=Burkholderia cenocepacia TaxID=95486 RepID=UPI0007611E9E|nr:macro domain-containing protein [Burkholderia cenocepacia]KWU23370.1 hypothetical protein AS149_37505 [Burkholderia cenocepacia]